MAFLTYNDISGSIPDVDKSTAERLLSFAEVELLGMGLDFTDPPVSASEKVFTASRDGQAIFSIPYCHGITQVALKDWTDSSYLSVLNTGDYLSVSNTRTSAVFQVNLLRPWSRIKDPIQLAVTAKWTLPAVDWSSSTYLPLKNALIEYVMEQDTLNKSMIGGRAIVSSSTKSSSVTFDSKSVTTSLCDSDRFKQIISLYV